ncbi:flagellar hook-length control protein FliK [Grimontia sp. NTOU-MAR1]|uniref:flagellar hook-length control protein FliK n=1 Tax=Grimontia sp. NTOU-MAR1 TaxID=3111011 RepID=UPI002DBB1D40|nr:flagellar hook-length control protein FliK [Grimontia sp. NTOU-MAR1]WRV98737.1 flagellar hook-length control protein FliK [Grimontia sp. NTOU-MAR1]
MITSTSLTQTPALKADSVGESQVRIHAAVGVNPQSGSTHAFLLGQALPTFTDEAKSLDELAESIAGLNTAELALLDPINPTLSQTPKQMAEFGMPLQTDNGGERAFKSDIRGLARVEASLIDSRTTQTLQQPMLSQADAIKPGQISLAGLEPSAQQNLQQVLNNLPQIGVSTSAQANFNPATNASPSIAVSPEWATVKVDTSQSKWGEQMMQVLQDRVTLQAQQNMQEARIRLDPPDLGKLDLLVRVEGDRLSVNINANTVATREALVQISERLRAELQNQNFVHVDVNVGDGESGSSRQSHADDDLHIFAARDIHNEPHSSTDYGDHWLNTQA